jgi:hypothetical protein
MSDIGWNGRWDSQHGMTLRDYFAGQALVGLLAGRTRGAEFTPEEAASSAYRIADAMIKERDV